MGNIVPINMESVPTARVVTTEDRRLFPIYIQILDLDSAGKCWKETTRKLLAINPAAECRHTDRNTKFPVGDALHLPEVRKKWLKTRNVTK